MQNNHAKNNLEVLNCLIETYHTIKFVSADHFAWDPDTSTIRYASTKIHAKEFIDALLHEIGHSILGHKVYRHDFELVQMEVNAWRKAKELAKSIGYKISSDYMEDCLDSYRNWQYQRSLCPTCNIVGVAQESHSYICLNCRTRWTVPTKQLCRIRRMKISGSIIKSNIV